VDKVVIVGGCGHVGLPLALVIADLGYECVVLDKSQETVGIVNSGQMPFEEEGASELLKKCLSSGNLWATTEPESLKNAEVVIVVVGTPIDEHLNPDPNAVVDVFLEYMPFMNSNQLVILRSTVFPGVTGKVIELLKTHNLFPEVTFCPERILEGRAIRELRELPQIIGANTESGAARASLFFLSFGIETLVVTPEEAELAKLFTNVWRYIKFAAANQFWIMSNEAGLDFAKIRNAITFDYERAADLPGAGFAAGPCLFKDTMQLAAFSNNNFILGHSAMLVNEGLPLYVATKIGEKFNLANKTIGILGAAFKGESDDVRSSLSYKLKKILLFKAKAVLMTDPYVTSDTSLSPLDYVLKESDILLIATPHYEYRKIDSNKPVIDIWNLLGKGSKV
jgi:UDP-N-acetyl-D-mannosaminuronic acid dehydrogenase